MGLTRPTAGAVTLTGQGTTPHRDRRIQMIFQDPAASLNPRMTVAATLSEPVRLNGLRQGAAAVDERVRELLRLVGLDASAMHRYPHEFSGGQKQRVGIALSLIHISMCIRDRACAAHLTLYCGWDDDRAASW